MGNLFFLPNVKNKLISDDKGMFMVDQDVGEMILILMFGGEVWPYYGTDINHLCSEDNLEWKKYWSLNWEILERKMMGLTDSPYNAYQSVIISREIYLG